MLRRRSERDEHTQDPVVARAPAAAPDHELILRLQRGAGNAAVQRMMSQRTLQRGPPTVADPAPAEAAPAAADPAVGGGEQQSFAGFVETVKQKLDELKTAEDDLKAATGAAAKKAKKKLRDKAVDAHQAAVLALAGWTRENMPPRAVLNGYLDRTDVKPDQKVATLGQLAAAVARMEFLLGTMYHQGTKAKWEKGNKGKFPDTYDAAIKGGAQPWCTKFAGYAYTRLGFMANKEGTTSEFMSGYRLREWSAEGKGIPAKKGAKAPQITAADQTVAGADDTGSVLIDRKAWERLRKDLKKAKTEEDRKKVTQAFFAVPERPAPQAGDIVVKPRGDAEATNNFSKGLSHTMLVESYDAASFKIHTIEGNVGDKVGGRTIDLTNAVDVSKIIFLTRMGTQFFGASPTAAGGTGATGTSISGPAQQASADFGGGIMGGIAGALTALYLNALYSAETLTGGMQNVNAKLVEINAAQGWIKSADADAAVTDWTGGAGSGNES